VGNLGSPSVRTRALIEDYGLEAVVELGIGHGGSMQAVLGLGIPVVYLGCDTDPEAIRICKEMVPAGIFALEPSTVFLKKILGPMPFAMRTLWFLDAHFGNHADDFPLLAELELLAAFKPGIDQDVIVCDDIRVIADDANPRYWPGELEAPYVRDEHPWAAYTMPFRQTHETRVVLDDEGYLVLVPRTLVAQRVRE